MLDMFGLPSGFMGDVQIFTRPCTANTVELETWRKPRGVTMCMMICIGGGGGGGGGRNNASSATARGGGGGGGGSAIARLFISALHLPDVLYVQVGAGGAGGAGNAAGASGVISYVSLPFGPNANHNNYIHSTSQAAAGGNPGTGSAGGTGGTAATVSQIGVMPHAGGGLFSFIAGQDGANGGAHTGAIGGAITLPVTGINCTGGAGGAGVGVDTVNYAGGIITPGASWLAPYCAAAPAAGAFNGSGGQTIWQPLFGIGGTGGSSCDNAVGGSGGPGGLGSGGGGGGGGTTTGGRGGTGGNGLVIIACW